MNKTLYWTPRIFGILFVVFTALFVLDVFEGRFIWGALFTHLLPSLVALVVLLVAWFKEKIGGVLWILLAIVYVVITWGDIGWQAYLTMFLPAVVLGILFLMQKKDNGGNLQQNQSAPISQVPQQPTQSAGDGEVRDQTQD